MTEVATLDLPGLELPAAPVAAPAAPAVPACPRERYRAVLRDALPEGLVLSAAFWAVALAGADEYAAAMVERHARRPGGLDRRRT